MIIVGAAGRDFHNFNVYFKENTRYEVVAFTAAQIPDIEGRFYPPELAGRLYPRGIPIHPEREMAKIIRDNRVDLVAFSYSDVSHVEVMHKASIAMSEGADFILLGATYTMLKGKKPVIAVCAVRTGCGKSQTTRKICRILQKHGKQAVVVRHPMPYGDLTKQVVQRFSSYDDFDLHHCTIEEREEYEPLIDMGIVVYAGVDYERILRSAEEESPCHVIVWDGGNNDTPFFYPDVHVVVFDPHRAGHELLYYPGETNLLMANIALINKIDTALPEDVEEVRKNIERFAPKAEIVLAESPVSVDNPDQIQGKRVLVVEDGPTLTHGGMPFGAATIAARQFGAAEIVDVHPYAQGSIGEVLQQYPHIQNALPAMGYSSRQVADLQATVNAASCDLVLFATPIHLGHLLTINKPTLRVRYEYKDHSSPFLEEVLLRRIRAQGAF